MELRKVRPQWPAPEWVEALCTVRTGGFSRAPYDSFNLGTHVGDRPEHVALNRERLREELGAAGGVLYLNQIHGTAVVEARSSMTGLPPVDADAAVTRERDLAVAVMTADCLPVLFFNCLLYTSTSVRGKIFADIINTIILLLLRKEIRASKISTSELFGVAQSWMCFYSRRNDEILIETPNLQTKELCKLLGIKKIPINIKNFATEIENFYQGK